MKRPAKRAAKPAPATEKPAKAPVAATLAARITEAPQLSAPKEARARLAEWQGDIDKIVPGRALKRLLDEAPKVEALLTGLADGSPYLWDLASREPARLLALLQSDPDDRFAALLADTAKAVAATRDEAEAMRLLRRMKSEAALLIALADIGGAWPVMQATRAITELADTAVASAVRFLLARCRRAAAGSSRQARAASRTAAATSCSPWARWAPTSSTIRAIST